MIIGIDGTVRLRREMAPRRIIQHTVGLILIVCLGVLYVCVRENARYWSNLETIQTIQTIELFIEMKPLKAVFVKRI